MPKKKLIVTPEEFEEEQAQATTFESDDASVSLNDFEWSAMLQTEAEKLMREDPTLVDQLVERYLHKEITLKDFAPSERQFLLQVLLEKKAMSKDESLAVKALMEADYVRTPPTPEEFLENPLYLGRVKDEIYPYWKEQLKYVLDPKNQIYSVAVKGSIGSGKCAHNFFVFNDLGMLRIQELYEKRKETRQVLSESGMRTITNFHDEGETETIKIATYDGFIFECRPNHRIRVFDGKNIVWKEAQNLLTGDQAVIVRNVGIWGKNPYELSVEEAELFGIITGDGCSLESYLNITFGAREEDVIYMEHVEENVVRSVVGNKYRLHKTIRKSGQELYRLDFYHEYRKRAQGYGITGRAWEKKVPLCVRMGTKEIVAAFLRGYFDTDGSVYVNNNTLEVSTCSEQLSEEVQLLLLNFGIRTRRSFKANKSRGSWTVKILGKESKEIFEREIGFNHHKKKALLRKHLSYEKTTWRDNDTEVIPVDKTVVEEARSAIRYKRIGLKHNNGMFACLHGGQSFTYKNLDRIVDDYGIEYLPTILKKIYTERYIFTPITKLTPSRNHCYDLTVEGDPSYVSNGFISHNTWFSILCQLYKLIHLSCLRNIPAYFKLSETTKITFGLFTLSLAKADMALANDFKQMISLSPYFRNTFPLKKTLQIRRVLNTIGDSTSMYEVMLPKNIALLIGSKLQHALSLAVISGIIDEVNFRQKRTVAAEDDEDSAGSLYNELYSRMASRFIQLKSVPGILCVVSSARSTNDFLENHIEKVKNDPHVHICGGSQWDVIPEKYSKERFYVFVGNSKSSSRIIPDEDVALYPPGSPNILAVPTSIKDRFEYDINSALNQFAGIATTGLHLLFEDPLLIGRAWDTTRVNPFIEEEIELGLKTNKQIIHYMKWDELFRDAGFAVIPRHHPGMLRVMHIDLSKSNDITGIAMGGVSAITEKVSRNPEGQYNVKQLSPEIWMDFVLGIKAPQGDQIDYEKIHQFIAFLRESRFKIRYITFDRWGSVGPMQMLIKNGFEVGDQSVDTNDLAYVYLKDTIVNRGISMYHHSNLERELMRLTHKFNNGRAKVDHPPNGSKDISDATAGVVYNCMELLTNPGKFPDTANQDIAKGVISNLFPAMAMEKLPGAGWTELDNEFTQMDWHISKSNPYDKYSMRPQG